MLDPRSCLHVGIPGNEKAGRAAKSALLSDSVPFTVPFTDIKPVINECIKATLVQDKWSENTTFT